MSFSQFSFTRKKCIFLSKNNSSLNLSLFQFGVCLAKKFLTFQMLFKLRKKYLHQRSSDSVMKNSNAHTSRRGVGIFTDRYLDIFGEFLSREFWTFQKWKKKNWNLRILTRQEKSPEMKVWRRSSAKASIPSSNDEVFHEIFHPLAACKCCKHYDCLL